MPNMNPPKLWSVQRSIIKGATIRTGAHMSCLGRERLRLPLILVLIAALLAACNHGADNSPSPARAQTVQPTGAPTAVPATALFPAVPCESAEKLTYHVHARLRIYNGGQPITVPQGIGIEATCIYWLHTHDTSGLIHVEAPGRRDFVLRQFFGVWGQPLDSTHVLNLAADTPRSVKAWLDGKEWMDDPGTIPLQDGYDIVLAFGPPFPPGLP